MSIKYIQETKKGEWKVSSTKTGRSLRILESKKEAIIYASSIKATKSIFVKNDGKWFETLEDESKTKAAPKRKVATKKPVAKKTTTKATPKKKVTTKKPVAKKTTTKATPKKKVTTKKPVAKKTTTKATPKKKVTTKKPVAKKTTTKATPKKKVATKKPVAKKTTTKATPKKKVTTKKPLITQHDFIVEDQKKQPSSIEKNDNKTILVEEGRVGKWYKLLVVFAFLFAIAGAFIAAWFLVD